ncbi:MAG: DNA translocase FtsK [Lewinellaceae bacterium]|nr:DNA translocase FtsK [Saprospiraceae bacterium]MCB9338124.1 DNA translocase FtsK [Lewinellaceae bacterium]
MAKKRNPNQLSFKLGDDERIPKLGGVLLMFLAAYLFIAFASYLFTWKDDYDDVNSKSLGELFSDGFQASNMLGRLGAVVSNTFFWWGFGLPSFFLVYLLAVYGWSKVKRVPLRVHRPLLRQTLVLMVFLSVFLEFLFGDATFPWGGAFGEAVSAWMTSFVGVLGMIVLFMFIFAGIIVWFTNPNFNELTPRKAWYETKLWFSDIFNRRYTRRKPQADAASTPPVSSNRPASTQSQPVRPKPEQEPIEDGQVNFNLGSDGDREKPKSLKPGDAEFEIEMPKPAEPVPVSDPPMSPAATPQASLFPDIEAAKPNENFSEPYDPTLELSSYEHPILALLNDYDDQKVETDRSELEANKDQIIDTLLNYKIEIVKIRATIGPTVTLYEIIPAPGVRISRIKNLEDDIALSLAALGIRIIAPIPGRGTIGIEVPNKNKQIVPLKEMLMSDKFKRSKMDLPIALGKSIANEVFVIDLAKMPHLLIAGATGQGKSVGINAVLLSILYKKHPSQVKLVLIDPKKVELFPYAKLVSHFLAVLPGQDEPITTETSKVVHILNSLCIEMDTRYNLMKKAHVRNITEYNEKFVARKLNPNNGHEFMPFIVLIIDEFADLIMTAGKEIELPIGRLAQLARAVGIHLVIATQRPSVNIITGVIKANFPARIAYKVSAKVDSRTILDASGAEQLVGRGDMLLSVGGDMVRLQCAFVDTPEVEKVIQFIADQRGYPEPHFLPEFHGDDEGMNEPGAFDPSDVDEMMEDAAKLIVQSQHGSTSMIQRRMKLGYNRAGRIMDQLEAIGVVGPAEGSKPREVLIYDEMELERYLESWKNRK